MDRYIERLEARGLTLWLPPMPSPVAAQMLRDDIAEVLARAISADDALELLDIHGFALGLNVEHHGPQTYRIWTLAPRADTWASARCQGAAA